jgi:hypothetical protein
MQARRLAHHAPGLLVLLVLAACARAEAPLTAGDVAGCWALRWQAGDTPIAAGMMPDSVRLDTAVLGGTDVPHRRTAFAGRSVPSGTRGPGDALPWYRAFPASWWEVRAGDSVRIVFNDHWTQYETDLRVRGRRLEGTATFRADDGPPAPPRPLSVRGERFPCPPAAP